MMRYNEDKMIVLTPLSHELPSEFATRVGSEYIRNQTLDHKKAYAQYFTPVNVSRFMAGLAKTNKDTVKIADLGAGTGVLGISVCEALAKQNPKPRRVLLT